MSCSHSQCLIFCAFQYQMAPEDPAINYWLSRSYYEEKNYDLAIAYGEQAVKGASQNAEYHRWLGRAYGAKAEQSHSFFLARKVKKAFETPSTSLRLASPPDAI